MSDQASNPQGPNDESKGQVGNESHSGQTSINLGDAKPSGSFIFEGPTLPPEATKVDTDNGSRGRTLHPDVVNNEE